ncbi:MAG: enoyl-CoA hydratase [Gammaproteobacteria bacterium HGW-Gammaproteobacteria-14]|nr:MAG: enoyl-CoA hydratase [Gammaproteobacteria bacterium HGW-Gammaproteobacteria-14]
MSHISECQEIQVTENLGVLEVAIQRPDRKNALTHAMYTAINQAFDYAEREPTIRALLITGTEGCFTAGNDMVDFLQNPPIGDDAPVMILLGKLATFPKPLIAAVNGPAVGVGTTLLFHCDLVYVGESAKLQMPFTSLGLCPEAGSSYLLPLMIGHQRAAELLMLGEVIDGQRACQLGIANAVLADAETLSHARAQAARIVAQPAAAVRLTKELMRAPFKDMLHSHMKVEGDAFGKRLVSPEGREAMQAFMEKRKPNFSQFD